MSRSARALATLTACLIVVVTAATAGGISTARAASYGLNAPVVGIAGASDGHGYWMVAGDGGVFPFGPSAPGHGSAGGMRLNQPVVGMAATPDGGGYWLVAADGGMFPFGDAAGYGSAGGLRLNRPIVGMAATPDGRGYWLVASDGGIFPFGDAAGYGSTGGIRLNQPIVGMAASADGGGYWLVAADGGIFPFGDAAGYGSTGAIRLNRPIVGITATRDGLGYWLVASDGGVFPFGDAVGHGSTGGLHLNAPIVGMAAPPDGGGYWLAAADGGIFPFGSAPGYGSATPPPPAASTVAGLDCVTGPNTTSLRPASSSSPLGMYSGGDSVAGFVDSSRADQANGTGRYRAFGEYHVSSGLGRPDYYDWPAHLRDEMAQRNPDVVTVMFGANDTTFYSYVDGSITSIGSAHFNNEYPGRVGQVMDMLTGQGRRVFWIGQPIMRDAGFDSEMRLVDGIYRRAAESRPGVTYCDSRALFSDSHGQYTAYLPDGSGHMVLVRGDDGIHLTPAGGQRLAAALLAVISRG
jgi:lysophospholipase L1-like esterase